MNAVVWESELDGKYRCVVTRTEPYRGKLEMWEGESLCFESDVSLSYNAQFGPDVYDVNDWTEACVKWVDDQDRRSKP